MYESPIMLFETDQLIQCEKNETDTMIIQCIARAGVHVDKEELIKALEYDRGQYEKGYRDGRMYVTPCPSNADRIRMMTDEELAGFLFEYGGSSPNCKDEIVSNCKSCRDCWIDWLKQEETE